MEGEVRLILQWLCRVGRGFLSEDLTFEWRPGQCEVRYINMWGKVVQVLKSPNKLIWRSRIVGKTLWIKAVANSGASQVLLVVKNLFANAGHLRDADSIPGLGRSLGVGNGNPLQYSYLKNSMDRRAWQAISMRLQRVGLDWSNLAHTHMPQAWLKGCRCWVWAVCSWALQHLSICLSSWQLLAQLLHPQKALWKHPFWGQLELIFELWEVCSHEYWNKNTNDTVVDGSRQSPAFPMAPSSQIEYLAVECQRQQSG